MKIHSLQAIDLLATIPTYDARIVYLPKASMCATLPFTRNTAPIWLSTGANRSRYSLITGASLSKSKSISMDSDTAPRRETSPATSSQIADWSDRYRLVLRSEALTSLTLTGRIERLITRCLLLKTSPL
jgi:hypothetical protein